MQQSRDFDASWRVFSSAFSLAQRFARTVSEKREEDPTEAALNYVIDQGYFEAVDRHGILRQHSMCPGKVGGPRNAEEASKGLKVAFCFFGDDWPGDSPAVREMVKHQPGYYLPNPWVLALVRVDYCTDRDHALTLLDLANRAYGCSPDVGWNAQRIVMGEEGGEAWKVILDMECRAIRGQHNGQRLTSARPTEGGYYRYLNAAFGCYCDPCRVNSSVMDYRRVFVQRAARDLVAAEDNGRVAPAKQHRVGKRSRPILVHA